MLASGTKLGPYEILSALGAGGMGEVYRARDARLKREVAIKVLPAAMSADPERLRRFESEAEAASALNHPNILSIFDIGTENGAPYIVSELLEGETLRDAPRRRRLHAAARDRPCPADRPGPGRRAREGHRAPRPEAGEHLRDRRRAREDPGLRPGEAHAARQPQRQPDQSSRPPPSRGSSWGRSGTWRRSRCAARAPTRAPTSSRSARSSTRCSRAGERFTPTPPPTRSARS